MLHAVRVYHDGEEREVLLSGSMDEGDVREALAGAFDLPDAVRDRLKGLRCFVPRGASSRCVRRRACGASGGRCGQGS